MKKALPLMAICALCLAGCPTDVPPVENTGSLVLTFSALDLAAKTITPPLDMSLAYCNISGSGPNGTVFSESGMTAMSLTKASLPAGSWTVIVDAFNSTNTLIGSGSSTVSVIPGTTVEAAIVVGPLTGTGSLVISVSWPEGALVNPVLTGTLKASGGSPSAIPFPAAANPASYTYASLNAGYYSIVLQLADDSGVKWGAFETARIIKGQITTASFTLTMQDINTGGMHIVITPSLQNPIGIVLSGQQSELPGGADMTVTATTSDSVDSYQWYLNGAQAAGATTSSITIGSGLAIGHYRLDLCVQKGNIISSEHVTFTVLDTPAGMMTTNAAETGVKLDIYVYKGSQFTNPLYAIWVEDTGGTFIQDILVSNAPGTNFYPLSYEWVARPMSVPYWAHKACIEDPYKGAGGHDSTGMYLAYPTSDGGPIPLDLDAVTGATSASSFLVHTARKNDGLTQFTVLMEINRSRDYNTAYPVESYNPGGQPSVVYGATIQPGSGQQFYTMSVLGTGHPLGSDGSLGGTSGLTTALDIVSKVIIHVVP